jgi:hypothetical protein
MKALSTAYLRLSFVPIISGINAFSSTDSKAPIYALAFSFAYAIAAVPLNLVCSRSFTKAFRIGAAISLAPGMFILIMLAAVPLFRVR